MHKLFVVDITNTQCRQEVNAIGPGIGPAAVPPPLASLPPPPASLPAPPQASGNLGNPAYSAATISSGPQPASAYPPPVMLPPLHYQGLDAAQPFGYQPPAAGMHPSRAAALAAANGALQSAQAGTVRSADEMEGNADDIPPAKRQRVAKLPGGQLYAEADWIARHPVSRTINILSACLTTPRSIRFHFKSSCPTTILNLNGNWTEALLRFQICP